MAKSCAVDPRPTVSEDSLAPSSNTLKAEDNRE